MSDEKMYCPSCFHKLRRIPGGYGCKKCGLLIVTRAEEMSYNSIDTLDFGTIQKAREQCVLGLWARLWAKVRGEDGKRVEK